MSTSEFLPMAGVSEPPLVPHVHPDLMFLMPHVTDVQMPSSPQVVKDSIMTEASLESNKINISSCVSAISPIVVALLLEPLFRNLFWSELFGSC